MQLEFVFKYECAPVQDSDDIESSSGESGDNEVEDKERILLKTVTNEKATSNAKGVHFKEAIEAFEKKNKNMDPTEITNAETAVDKAIEALAEQQAQALNKNLKIIEGDIIENEHLRKLMRNATYKRGIQKGRKWNLLIPYELPNIITGEVGMFEQAINEAIREISSKSCLKFIKRLNNGGSRNNKDYDGTPEPYLKFMQGQGCYSYAGKQIIFTFRLKTGVTERSQPVSIGHGCEFKGTVLHEIMHALGFLHEHTRRDRDNYIKINWNNIEDAEKKNFNMYNHGQAETFGFGYDLDSVMHYGANYFSKNGQNTIDVINDPNKSIGDRWQLSTIDKLQLNRLYCTEESISKHNDMVKKSMKVVSKNVYAPAEAKIKEGKFSC
ncbi:high choriolytic enzyme 1 isoform X2 [Hydra vulgaris]|uniref:high choriolytic enzyme 1 isoform X2 n=1 Tax=Hydra vulgaris TaxID=6087 RepID=UPI001F5EFC8A|nr:high choriolytic enzyme 1 isoform X2 [Hydra vulgaris]